jgi:preprotein translocase subunit SecD
MIRLPRWKVILVIVALVYGVAFALPNVLPDQALATLPAWLPHNKINLGLDLRGGSYLLYEVDTAALKNEKLTNLTEDVRNTLQQKQIASTPPVLVNGVVDVRINDPSQIDTAIREFQNLGEPLPNGGGRDVTISTAPDQHIHLSISDQAMQQESFKAVDQNIEIVRRRVDAMGTKEASITRQGSDRIVIEAPGESDPEKLKAIVGKTAKLTFQMVDETVSPEDIAAGRIPPGDVLLPSDDPHDRGGLVVNKRVVVSGEMLVSANAGFDPRTSQPDIEFRFNGQGTRRFAEVSSENVNKRFAIVLDNRIIEAPNIEEPITTGSGQISGNMTTESAAQLALLLRSGALPAPMKVVEQNTVGAELGADSIHAGVVSLAIGAVSIFVFIILAYGLFGIFSACALLLNALLMAATLSFTQATLTLPGIAGMVLTLAVAIDANVLIFERMRDEARAGRSVVASVDHGYSLAYPSIADANITSLISALILMEVGSGAVKGFAWTLTIGVISSVFTAILVTQVLIGWWFRLARPKKLPI